MSKIFKIESKGKISYKADSFWSLFDDIKDAKVHDEFSDMRLANNLISLLNRQYDNEDRTQTLNFYNNAKIGYDIVKSKQNYFEFDVISEGPFIYQIKYNEKEGKYFLIDISKKEERKTKLKKLEII